MLYTDFQLVSSYFRIEAIFGQIRLDYLLVRGFSILFYLLGTLLLLSMFLVSYSPEFVEYLHNCGYAFSIFFSDGLSALNLYTFILVANLERFHTFSRRAGTAIIFDISFFITFHIRYFL